MLVKCRRHTKQRTRRAKRSSCAMAVALPSLAKLPRAAPTGMEAEEAQTQGANASDIVATKKFVEAGLAFARSDFENSTEAQAMNDAYAELREVWRSSIRDPSQPTDANNDSVEEMMHTARSIVMTWAQHYVNGSGNVAEVAESMLSSMKRPASAAKEGMYFFTPLMHRVEEKGLREKKINEIFAEAGISLNDFWQKRFLQLAIEHPEKIPELENANRNLMYALSEAGYD